MDANQSLSRTVMERIAAREGTTPAELSEPLYSAIDPEALDGLFRGSSGQVVFTYQGYEVTVTSESDISVTPLPSV
jgi:hypothetical protein